MIFDSRFSILRAAPSAASLENLKSKIESPAVLTLADLPRWSHEGTALAVLGHPIGHSISPAMHNAALARLAQTAPRFLSWNYVRFDVPPEDLPVALQRLHTAGFFGLNLTVPHKVIAFEHVAEIDSAARLVGAVNTLRRTAHGWRGFNTDGYGLSGAIRETLGRELAGQHVVLLGAGGAARGAAVECLQRGCASLLIANRSPENLTSLLAAIANVSPAIPRRGFAPAMPPADLPPRVLVVNATSAGLRDSDPAPIDLATLPSVVAVYDMIYNPPQTRLLRQAAALGLPHANGLSMLVHQGAKALEIWSGVPAAQTAPTMDAAAHAVLGLLAKP